MKRSLILSNLRTELRKKQADYHAEKAAQKWVSDFFDELAIVHSSQIRHWHREWFLSRLKSRDITGEELLQAKSAILFLYKKVLKVNPAAENGAAFDEAEMEPGVFRVTA